MISSVSGFFVPGFPKLMRFQEHHDRILKKIMPKLKQHLVRHNTVFIIFYIVKLLEALSRPCVTAGQPGGVYQSVHHEVVLPVLPGQSEYPKVPAAISAETFLHPSSFLTVVLLYTYY